METETTEKRKRGRPKGSFRKGSRPDITERNKNNGSPSPFSTKKVQKTEKKEEITRIVGESVQYFKSCTVRNDEELMDRIDNYFQQCLETGQIPTVEDMALAIGITTQRMYQWEHQIDGRNQSRAEIIQRAKAVLAAIDAKLVTEGKIPQVTYIFRSKNFFGMKDQQETIITHNNPLGENVDIERIKQKYLDNTYGVMDGEFSELPKEDVKALPSEIDTVKTE